MEYRYRSGPITSVDEVVELARNGWKLNKRTKDGKTYYYMSKWFPKLKKVLERTVSAKIRDKLLERMDEVKEAMKEYEEARKRMEKEKAKAEEVARAETLERETERPTKPLHKREIEEQLWWKNMCYELGRVTFGLFVKHVDFKPEDITLDNWEEAFNKIKVKVKEAHDFWTSNPELRQLDILVKTLEVERDMYAEACKKLRDGVIVLNKLLQTALTLMPKEQLEKYALAISMADIGWLKPALQVAGSERT